MASSLTAAGGAAGAAVASTKPAPKPGPAQEPKTKPKAVSGAGSAQLELYKSTVALPADESRKLAVQQKEKLSQRLSQAKDRVGNLLGRWRQFDEDVAAIEQFLTWGDELKDNSDEASRKKRRELYAKAYVRGRTAAQFLDTELADGSTYEVILKDLVSDVNKAADAAAKTATATLESVGKTAETGLYLTIAALGVALLAYANQRGKR